MMERSWEHGWATEFEMGLVSPIPLEADSPWKILGGLPIHLTWAGHFDVSQVLHFDWQVDGFQEQSVGMLCEPAKMDRRPPAVSWRTCS